MMYRHMVGIPRCGATTPPIEVGTVKLCHRLPSEQHPLRDIYMTCSGHSIILPSPFQFSMRSTLCSLRILQLARFGGRLSGESGDQGLCNNSIINHDLYTYAVGALGVSSRYQNRKQLLHLLDQVLATSDYMLAWLVE